MPIAPRLFVSSRASPAIALACVISGAAALIFENVWFRASALVMGCSVASTAVVTASFMVGLGLGSLLTASIHRKIRNYATVYIAAELAIAAFGVGGFMLLFHGHETIAGLLARWHEHVVLLAVVRAATTGVILIAPAVCIGATLPLLVGLRDDGPFGPRLARLYAWNTLGAVIGSLVCEFLLIGAVGLPATALFAGGGNLVAAGLIAAMARQPEHRVVAELESEVARAAGTMVPVRPQGGRLLAAAFLAGFNLLALEVLWFRFLQLFFSGTTRTFAVMLAIVLAGISLGGALVSRLTIHRPRRTIRGLALAAAALITATYWSLPYVEHAAGHMLGGGTRALLVVATFQMGPICVISGALFGLIGTALHARLGHPVRTAGLLTLANTLGAMAGPLVAAFVFLPYLGIEPSFFVIAALYGLTGLLLLDPQPHGLRERSRLVALAACAAILICFPFGQMRERFFKDIEQQLPGSKLLHAVEGRSETSFYLVHETMGRPFYHRLVTNGYSMSSSDPRSMRYMKLFAWLPLALHAEARDALLVCFGVGSTAKALTETPWLRHIDVVDISPDILECSTILFPPPASDPLQDPRVHTHVEDGRFFLQTTPRTYDLITGEPPPTKIAGVVNLYTEEFFRLVRARLNPGGYCSYWLPVYQMRPDEARSIIRSFLNVFPESTLWEGGGLNWILLGRNGPGRAPTAAEFSRQWELPSVAGEMRNLGIEVPAQLGATFVADAGALDRFCSDAPPLEDAHPQRVSMELRERSPNAAEYRDLVDASRARERFMSSAWVPANLPAEVCARVPEFFRVQHCLNYALYPAYRPDAESVARDLRDVLRNTDLRTVPAFMLGSSPRQLAIAREIAAAGASTAEVEYHLATAALLERNYEAAAKHMRRSLHGNGGGPAPPVDLLAAVLAQL